MKKTVIALICGLAAASAFADCGCPGAKAGVDLTQLGYDKLLEDQASQFPAQPTTPHATAGDVYTPAK